MVKIKNKKCKCKYCKTIFFAGDKKASICPECFDRLSICPKCNNHKTIMSKTCLTCRKTVKGLTKKQITTKFPKWRNCGFKSGEQNLAKQIEVRKKISEGVKKSYTPELLEKRRNSFFKKNINTYNFKYVTKNGEKCRSKLELNFLNYLYDNNIKYKTEVPIKMKNGKLKIVDIVIDDVLIEISGYAYKQWQIDFNNKIKCLQKSFENPLIIIVPDDKYDYCFKELWYTNLFVKKYSEFDEILKTIKLCQLITSFNKQNGRYKHV